MRDIFASVERWSLEHEMIATATVIQTWGSAPRQAGSKMAVSASQQVCGSVSGGCVETAVIDTAFHIIKTGKPELLHFGVTHDEAWEIGLACGGSLEVFVSRFDPAHLDHMRAAIDAEGVTVIATVIQGSADLLGRSMIFAHDGSITGTLGSELDTRVIAAAREAAINAQPNRITVSDEPLIEVFFDVIAPTFELVIVGGVHVAVALAELAKVLNYRVTLIDPRGAFASEERFPNIDRLIHAFPTQGLSEIALSPRTAVVVLSHDPKLDDPALQIALPSTAFFVGAIGSKSTQSQRRERLLAGGMSEADLNKLHGPVGLDLGGRTPPETALAIMAEIVAARNNSPLARHAR